MSPDAGRGGLARLTVVAPCHNEADGLPRFHAELRRALAGIAQLESRVVYVDDGSTDATLAVLEALEREDPAVSAYSLSRNFGHQVALTAGCDVATGDLLVFMDSDLQHPPSLLPEMVRRWRAGADVVSAVRVQTAGVPPLKRWSAGLFYALLNSVSDTRIVPGAADFVLLSARARDALRSMPERHRFLRGMVSWIGFRRDAVEYAAPARQAGRSSYTLARMLRLGADALFSFSTAPVRLATRLGLAVVSLGALYLAYILYTVLRHPQQVVPGWTSLIIVVLLLSGLQILFTGLIGEYIARIFEESKARPLYFFKRRPPGETGAPDLP